MNLDDLVGPGRRQRRQGRPPEVARERSVEQQRRRARAVHYALEGLRTLHQEEFDELFEQAKIKVASERGPLPGDKP